MVFRKFVFLLLLAVMGILLAFGAPMSAPVLAQQPTGSVPTVTGTPSGPMVLVDPSLGQIDVYSGPSSFNYPRIGVLLSGIRVPALGRARGDNDWIMIRYEGVPRSVGWVYGLYVSLVGGSNLPLVDIPPTPTPASTPTINPTLAAAFIPSSIATHLPTYTPVAPLDIPAFADETQRPSRIPVGLLIFGFAFIGVLGALISFLRGR